MYCLWAFKPLAGDKSPLSCAGTGMFPQQVVRTLFLAAEHLRPEAQNARTTHSAHGNAGSLVGPGKPISFHPQSPAGPQVGAPTQPDGLGIWKTPAPAQGQGRVSLPRYKELPGLGLVECRKIPLEGNRGEFPHDLHMVGASPCVCGEQQGRNQAAAETGSVRLEFPFRGHPSSETPSR